MGKIMLVVCLIVFCSSLGYGFIPTPLDSPVVVDYTIVGGSTGSNWGRGIARDSHGWIYAVYIMDNNYLVQLSRSVDNGRTWSRFALLNNPWSAYPNIAIDRGDSIYVDWERLPLVDTIGHDIYFSKYTGVSWTPPVNVSNEHTQGSLESSSLALDGSGIPHLTWVGTGPHIWYSDYENNIWSTPEIASLDGTTEAAMCADTENNLHLAWPGVGIEYKERSSGVWGSAEQASPDPGWQPCIVIDSRCRPHIVYSDTIGIISYVMRDSSGWSTPYLISDSIGSGANGGPSITCDKYGRLYVVWEGPESKGKLWYVTFDGTNWSQPLRLCNDTAYVDYDPRLGFPASDSGIDLIWSKDRPGGGYQVMYWRLPLLPVGVEERAEVRGQGLEVRLKPTPNPFTSFATLTGHESERFALYDITGRRVGTYKGSQVGGDLRPGVYFIKALDGKAGLARIVKIK